MSYYTKNLSSLSFFQEGGVSPSLKFQEFFTISIAGSNKRSYRISKLFYLFPQNGVNIAKI